MIKLTLECETISPMFIGNANDRKAELRPSTIEGALRFWWRALHPNLKAVALRKQETEFFGGSYIKNNKTENRLPSYRFLSISDALTSENAINTDERGGKGKAFAIKENQNFSINIQILRNQKKVLALFKLSSAFGGLGKRSRRGAGAWRIKKINNADNSIEYNKENIDSWIKIINDKHSTPAFTNSTFPYLISYEIGHNNYNTQKELRKKIMLTAHEVKDIYIYRECKKNRDGDCLMRNGEIVLIKNEQHYEQYLGKASGNRRLASPVYVSIIKTNENNVVPIITQLNFRKFKNQEQDNKGQKLQTEFKRAIRTNTNVNTNV